MRRIRDAMQSALHAATATLPNLRRGLNGRTAERAVPYLLALTGAAAIALADTRAVLAIEGEGREQVRRAICCRVCSSARATTASISSHGWCPRIPPARSGPRCWRRSTSRTSGPGR